MSGSPIRSLIAALLAACFALVTTAGSTMPGCPGQGGGATPGQHHAHGHSEGGPGSPSGASTCVVHLCCAQMALPATAATGGEHHLELPQDPGAAPAVTHRAARAPHTLPFAHAPPVRPS
ncbi:MAG TPA: hypothetical protein VMY76_05430 [Gemmatimonadales bacterium]|nr:hypothetical protein [Gemmatimonadales bacterium]